MRKQMVSDTFDCPDADLAFSVQLRTKSNFVRTCNISYLDSSTYLLHNTPTSAMLCNQNTPTSKFSICASLK